MTRQASIGGPFIEAAGFLRLVRQGRMTADEVRAEIGTATPFRKETLIHFDGLCGTVSSEVRLMVAKLLRRYRRREVRKMFPSIPPKMIEQIAKAEGIHKQESPSKGQRPKWDVEQVKQALNESWKLTDIRRTFSISYSALWKLRQQIGDSDRRRKKIFSVDERTAILADLKAGIGQSKVARKYRTHISRIRALQREVGMIPSKTKCDSGHA
jgi:hypothetical protein